MELFARILDQYDSWKSWGKGIVIALSLAIVCTLDYYTAYYLSYSVFYVIPVALAAWGFGKWAGAVIATLAAAIWAIIGAHTALIDFGLEVQVWNFLIRLSFLGLFSVVFAALHNKMRIEEALADTDALTGLSSKRRYHERLEQEILRAKRYSHPISIAYLDLDNFKSTNDQFGHETGDLVLRLVSKKITSHVRKTDISARLGGDEFSIVLLETGYDGAKRVFKKLQEEVNAEMTANGWAVTISIGALTYLSPPKDAKVMISEADALMYEVKRTGKNNIIHQISGEGA